MQFIWEEVLVVIPGRISLRVILPFYSVVIRLWAHKGNLVLFWEDLWLVEGALKILFPRLYALSSNHFGCVSSFVDSYVHLYNWNFGFRRNLNGVEVDELSRLLAYSGKGAGSRQLSSFLPQIWKSKVPPKIKFHVWLLALGKLNTCDKIQRRRPSFYLSPQKRVSRKSGRRLDTGLLFWLQLPPVFKDYNPSVIMLDLVAVVK
ncbi:PREDICTED: LOC110431707 isoform X1 [Prunus dulcis]|uniref:PREDICTED: LOC110431707 isoform X1 n=1 Tax=Prunus dulcis TaxID=3755 RepID=A0A5E4FHC4_PRUDU|nr:PREDICTED: LOC110431707 isoform X1 [Prunus dulcis]